MFVETAAPSLVAESLDFDPETELAIDLLNPEISDGQASAHAVQVATVADTPAASDTAIEIEADRQSTSPDVVSLEEEAQRREREIRVKLEQERRDKLNELLRLAKGGTPAARGQLASPSRKKPIVQERDDDDEREPLSLWKKGGIGISSVVGLWLLWSVGSHYLEIARARSPITLDGLCQEFATDVETARKKYDGGCFALTGKAEFVKSGKDVVLAIQTPNVPEWSIRCRFDMTPKLYKSRIVDRIQAGQEVTVEGRCSYEPRAGKGVIQMEECILRDGS